MLLIREETALPRTVTGTAIISGEFNVISDNNSSVIFTVQKWDGSSETEIGAAVTSQTETATGTRGFAVPIVLTQTLIKKGERLRIRCQFTGSGSSRLMVDPVGKAGFEPLKFQIPFKLDL